MTPTPCQSERREDIRDGCSHDVGPAGQLSRCASAIDAILESFRGRPVQTGLVRGACEEPGEDQEPGSFRGRVRCVTIAT